MHNYCLIINIKHIDNLKKKNIYIYNLNKVLGCQRKQKKNRDNKKVYTLFTNKIINIMQRASNIYSTPKSLLLFIN